MIENLIAYAGGFAPLGGCELLMHDVLKAVASRTKRAELVLWGLPPARSPLLADLASLGIRIRRSPWRWGSRWQLPDRFLLATGLPVVRTASVVFFTKSFLKPVLQRIRRAATGESGRVPFVLHVPYRPSEYWGRCTDPEELNAFDTMIVPAPLFEDELRALGFRGQVCVIPFVPEPLLPPPALKWPDNRGVIRVGYLGRFEPQKNLLYLVDAFAEFSRSLERPCELHLYGSGSDAEPLRRRVQERSLERQVHLHSAVGRNDLARVIDDCHLFAIPSVSEGQCLVAMEVLSRGRPLVATPVGALPDILSDNELGRLAPLDDACGFAQALLDVTRRVACEELTPARIMAAFQRRFSHERTAEQIIRCLESHVAPQPDTATSNAFVNAAG